MQALQGGFVAVERCCVLWVVVTPAAKANSGGQQLNVKCFVFVLLFFWDALQEGLDGSLCVYWPCVAHQYI
jgi:hypothetical protein